MVYQSRIKNATRRTTLVLIFLSLCGINIFAAGDSTANTANEPAAQQRPSPSPSVAPSTAMSRSSCSSVVRPPVAVPAPGDVLMPTGLHHPATRVVLSNS